MRTTLALVRCCLLALSPHSRRWGTLTPHLPSILAHLSALISHLLLPPLSGAAARAHAASGVPEAGGGGDDVSVAGRGAGEARKRSSDADAGHGASRDLAARWDVCVRAGGLVALALRRSEVLVLDTRGVSSALQAAVSLVSAAANLGFSLPAAADACGGSRRELAAGCESAQEASWEDGEVEGGEWLRRQALAAGVVARGCVVMETVSQILYALVARRPNEVPSALPTVMQCMAVFLDWLMSVGAHLPMLQRAGGKGGPSYAHVVESAVEGARNYSRLLVELSKDKKRFSKYAAHSLMAFVLALDRHPNAWPALLKDEVLNGVYAVIDTCGKFELQQVHGMLTQSSRPLFQGLVEDFKRSYKYTGEA